MKKGLVSITFVQKLTYLKKTCNLNTSRSVHTFDKYVMNNTYELCFDNNYNLHFT